MAQSTIREGAKDLPRISRILDNERLFVLVNENLIRQYASQLKEEVEPQVTELLRLAGEGLESLERSQRCLSTQVDVSDQKPRSIVSATSKMEMRRFNLLESQRERLQKEIQSLEAELARIEAS